MPHMGLQLTIDARRGRQMTTFEAPQPRSSLFLGTKRAHSEEAGNVHPSEARSQHTITTLPNLSTSTLVLLFKKVTELLTGGRVESFHKERLPKKVYNC